MHMYFNTYVEKEHSFTALVSLIRTAGQYIEETYEAKYNRDNSSHKMGGALSIDSRLSTHQMGTQCFMNGFGSSTAVAAHEGMLRIYVQQ